MEDCITCWYSLKEKEATIEQRQDELDFAVKKRLAVTFNSVNNLENHNHE